MNMTSERYDKLKTFVKPPERSERVERKERERLSRQADILKAAKQVFFKHGFEQTSMDMIAERCGLAKGTLYLYFKSKEELYVSLVEEGIMIMRQDLNRVAANLTTASERLIESSIAYYTFTQEHKEYFRILMLIEAEAINAEALFEKVGEAKMKRIQGLIGEINHGIETIITEEIQAGRFKASLDATEAMLMLRAATAGAMMILSKCERHQEMFGKVDANIFLRKLVSNLLASFSATVSCPADALPSSIKPTSKSKPKNFAVNPLATRRFSPRRVAAKK
ncbi:MAG: TetR/AcrR family transcriptional regulator [Rhizobacter sp.]|nr:TetR/AcrR family transcriptional regulator [Chlorobiales bacterium]